METSRGNDGDKGGDDEFGDVEPEDGGIFMWNSFTCNQYYTV